MKILKKLFKTGGPKTTTFYQLYGKVREWKKSGVYPYPMNLPEAISLPGDFWTKIIKLYKQTRNDGYERSISVFWVDGEIILAAVVLGDKSKVKPRGSVKIAYEPILKDNKYDYYWKKIWVDDKVYSRKKVYHKKVPKKLEKPYYLFNMHTHPPHAKSVSAYRGFERTETQIAGDYRGQAAYSYWSAQDIRSFLGSGAVVTGMISDRMHLLIRSSESPSDASDLADNGVTRSYLADTLKFGVYEGDFKKRLEREGLKAS
ncbi:hypothetical protein GF357_02640 [Candidatus Dojkabacteria bacterium]|nr:hypothetical protein [Candidatus Dojkabacteria bacterium]